MGFTEQTDGLISENLHSMLTTSIHGEVTYWPWPNWLLPGLSCVERYQFQPQEIQKWVLRTCDLQRLLGKLHISRLISSSGCSPEARNPLNQVRLIFKRQGPLREKKDKFYGPWFSEELIHYRTQILTSSGTTPNGPDLYPEP